MSKEKSIRLEICCLILTALIAWNHAVLVNVKTKGAKGDGKADDGPAIMAAWKEACAAGPSPSTVLIPPGTYFALPPVTLQGPCKGPIEVKAIGATLKAPPEVSKFDGNVWIAVQFVDKVTMTGGTFDGQGESAWKTNKCDASAKSCHKPVNLGLAFATNSLFKDLTSLNSKFFHFSILGCNNSVLEHITINAPGSSPNTDGMHIAKLNGLNITNSIIKTGDDCISFGDGCNNIHVDKVNCGPGHGISIGSLGKTPGEEPVKGIYIKNCTITGTQNGVRIKTWPDSKPGTVTDVHFEDIIMDKVSNPIIIDQSYCPSHSCKSRGPSNVKISNVSYRKIRGTSLAQVAIKLNCSSKIPCENIELADINLNYKGPGIGSSHCANVKPKVVGVILPKPCT